MNDIFNEALIISAITVTLLATSAFGDPSVNACRSYCGNITVDYPFGTRSGCGHPGFRELLFCVNDALMFHISSGTYRVLAIDYAYQAITLQDHAMSTCDTLVRGKANGFVVEPSRVAYLMPAPDNVFMLIGCRAESPLFQGFPGKHLPCRNVSGMGCEEYYECAAWDAWRKEDEAYGSGSPRCCAVSFGAIRAINLTKLQCTGYSSAYNVAPLRVSGPNQWAYGIRVSYMLPGKFEFCHACEATGGTCGYDNRGGGDLCMCGDWNSTTTCDSDRSEAVSSKQLSALTLFTLTGMLLVSKASMWMSL